MNNRIVLTVAQTEEIKRLALDIRKLFGIYGDVPIANDIMMLIEKKGIIVCQYPFEASEESHTDATLTWFETEGEPITFIGLNTARCYDEQIFALAHELYHFITRTGKAYEQNVDMEDKLTEKKADRFAAELLLPAEMLRSKVSMEFDAKDMNHMSELRILRFVVRLQCEWWLPYHALINRLFEENHINEDTYDRLYQIDDRDEKSIYCSIFKSLDNDKFRLLNEKTMRRDISADVLEIIIQNYEDGHMSEDEFSYLLDLYGKSPADLGFDMFVSREDVEELEELFGGGE